MQTVRRRLKFIVSWEGCHLHRKITELNSLTYPPLLLYLSWLATLFKFQVPASLCKCYPPFIPNDDPKAKVLPRTVHEGPETA